MNNYYYSLFLVFTVLAILIVMDPNFSRYIVLLGNMVKFNYEKMKWIVFNHPQNPIVRYFIWRRSWKMAKELKKSISENK